MSININCPNCRSVVRSPKELIGKKVQCPKCSTIFRVEDPNAGVEVVEDLEVVEDEPAPRPKRRSQPVDDELAEDRPRRRVARAGDDYEEEYDDGPRRSSRGGKPHRGGLILGLGIASLIVCAPLGIAAWTMGNTDLAEMRRGRMDPEGEGMTQAGRICGMISSILMVVAIGCYALIFVVAIVGGAAGR